MKKSILVTGGAGFIGSHLVRSLLAEDRWEVSVIDNFNDFYSPRLKRKNVRGFLEDPRFSLFEIDICDRNAVGAVFDRGEFDAVVHLAARAGVRPSLEMPLEYAETNVTGTVNLLEQARLHDVGQFVFGSSSSVYGATCDVPFKEDQNITKPISPYAATKVAGEVICHTYSHLYDVRTVCLRFFTVYGACQRPDLAIHKFAKLISTRESLPVFGDGSSRRDYTYIDDIIQGVRAAVDYDGSMHEIFNLGESDTVELKKLISLLEENLGTRAVLNYKEMQPGDVPQTYADISKARELLGYRPQTKIEEGIAKFVEWFEADRANGE